MSGDVRVRFARPSSDVHFSLDVATLYSPPSIYAEKSGGISFFLASSTNQRSSRISVLRRWQALLVFTKLSVNKSKFDCTTSIFSFFFPSRVFVPKLTLLLLSMQVQHAPFSLLPSLLGLWSSQILHLFSEQNLSVSSFGKLRCTDFDHFAVLVLLPMRCGNHVMESIEGNYSRIKSSLRLSTKITTRRELIC